MRTLVTISATVASLYVLLALVLYLMQERMLFLPNLPGRALDTTPAQLGLSYEDVQFQTRDGLTLHGWYIPAAEPRGTVLFFHGNAGNISHRLDSVMIFRGLALDTFIIDYRGYGRSEGKPGEAGTYLDAAAAWDHLVNQRGVSPSEIVVFGRSLGGAVAAWLVSQNAAGALIVESTFTSAVDMGRRLYSFMPVRLIARLKYPAVDYVAKARAPVLVVHSRNDEIIPFDMGHALFEAAPPPKAFLELSGDHNGAFLLSGTRYVEGLARFLDDHLRAIPDPAGRP